MKTNEINIMNECVCRVGHSPTTEEICIWFCADTVQKYPTLKNEMPSYWTYVPMTSNRRGMYFRLNNSRLYDDADTNENREILMDAIGKTLTDLGFTWTTYWNNEELFLILVNRK